jgi:hypothetical protein
MATQLHSFAVYIVLRYGNSVANTTCHFAHNRDHHVLSSSVSKIIAILVALRIIPILLYPPPPPPEPPPLLAPFPVDSFAATGSPASRTTQIHALLAED